MRAKSGWLPDNFFVPHLPEAFPFVSEPHITTGNSPGAFLVLSLKRFRHLQLSRCDAHFGFWQLTCNSEEASEVAHRLTENVNIDCRLSGDFPQTQPVGPGGAGCSHPDFIHPARSARRPVYARAPNPLSYFSHTSEPVCLRIEAPGPPLRVPQTQICTRMSMRHGSSKL